MTANDIYVIGIIIFYVIYYYFNVFRAHSTSYQPKSKIVGIAARFPTAPLVQMPGNHWDETGVPSPDSALAQKRITAEFFSP